MINNAKCWIGTSGYQYQIWKDKFYFCSTKDFFATYARNFDSVEINNTFYTIPKLHVVENWRFGPGLDLAYHFVGIFGRQDSPSQRFWDVVSHLKPNLGPILFQLHPTMKFNEENLNRLEGLSEILPPDQRFAFEFRDRSWWQQDVFRVLERHNWALVSLPRCPDFDLPESDLLTANFAYVRWHGHDYQYAGSYPVEELQIWARKVKKWRDLGIDCYCYFNNTDEGANAVWDAQKLQQLVSMELAQSSHAESEREGRKRRVLEQNAADDASQAPKRAARDEIVILE